MQGLSCGRARGGEGDGMILLLAAWLCAPRVEAPHHLACAIEGRRCISSEIDPETFRRGKARLEAGHTPVFPGMIA